MAGLVTKDEYQGLAEAVSLGLTVLKKCKVNTWNELEQAMDDADAATVKVLKTIDLDDRQLEVIGEWAPVLNRISIAPPVIPAVCPECDRYLLTSDTAPSRCMVTADCEGKPAKIAAARNAKPVKDA